MKKILGILVVLAVVISFGAGLELDKPIARLITRSFAPATEVQKSRLEDLWNLVDRPLKTNATMIRIEFYRAVKRDTNNVPIQTNYIVKAVDKVRVKLVEDVE